ncbi:hypothetical protein M3Y94_00270200 [Aphelenchoides besseyi]|nr:hypothetical protein M3Y94_00270200 [Aphelenchoides besseyi]
MTSITLALRLCVLILLTSKSVAELIPRRLLFGEPKHSAVSLSPNGSLIGFMAPNEQGITNVFVKCITCQDARPITFERSNHISGYYWTGVPDVILYAQDNNGDENTKLYKISLTNPNDRHIISDQSGVKAMIVDNNLQREKNTHRIE